MQLLAEIYCDRLAVSKAFRQYLEPEHPMRSMQIHFNIELALTHLLFVFALYTYSACKKPSLPKHFLNASLVKALFDITPRQVPHGSRLPRGSALTES